MADARDDAQPAGPELTRASGAGPAVRAWLRGPVAITGATGHVGRHVQARLADTPNEVRPLGRDADLASAFEDADAVIHLAGTLQPIDGNTYEAANVETVRRTIAALAGSAVKRVVLLSYVGADAASGNAYLRTKGEAERLVRACGRDAVVLRSTFIVGPPDDPGPSARAFISSGGRPVPVIGTGHQRQAPVHVADVADALVRLALDPSAPTGLLGIGGPDEMTVDALAETLNGRDVRERHLPRRVARALAHVVPSLTPEMVDVLAADSLPDAPLASDALGLELRSLGAAYARDGRSASAGGR